MVPAAWELTSPQKAVFPQVFKFIASSEGMAAATFPSLLPFLSKVPVDVMGDQEKFLGRWFSALEEAVGTVRGSLELKAVVVAYLDCLFFMLNQDWLEPGVVEHLVKAHLLALLLRASTEPRMAAAGVAQLMAPYLLAWDKQGNPKAAAGLFWQELSNEALTRVDNSETKDAEALLGLLVSLRSPSGESPHHLNQLVEQLWHLLLLHLFLSCASDPRANQSYFREFLSQLPIPLLVSSTSSPIFFFSLVRDLSSFFSFSFFPSYCLHPTRRDWVFHPSHFLLSL